ncbi:hypothetical protein N2152v2_006906 [Parachlorella kessleri]
MDQSREAGSEGPRKADADRGEKEYMGRQGEGQLQQNILASAHEESAAAAERASDTLHSGSVPHDTGMGEHVGEGQVDVEGQGRVSIHVELPTAEEMRQALCPHALESVGQASPVTTDVDPVSHLAPAVWPGAEGSKGRVAEILDNLRKGQPAQLSHGEVLLAPRHNKDTLDDLTSYHKLFDDLDVQKDNLFSLSDLADQRNTTTVCRSLWDLQLALTALGVEGVPEFQSSDLRRSCSMTRKTSIKAARFDTAGSPLKLPKSLHLTCLSSASGSHPSSQAGSPAGEEQPSQPGQLGAAAVSPTGSKSVGSLRRWLSGEPGEAAAGDASPTESQLSGSGFSSPSGVVSSRPAVVGGSREDALVADGAGGQTLHTNPRSHNGGDDGDSGSGPWWIAPSPAGSGRAAPVERTSQPAVKAPGPDSPGAESVASSLGEAAGGSTPRSSALGTCDSLSRLDGCNALEAAGAADEDAVGNCACQGLGAAHVVERALPGSPASLSPLSDRSLPSSAASDAGSPGGPQEVALTPTRLQRLSVHNPAFSPATIPHSGHASPAPAARLSPPSGRLNQNGNHKDTQQREPQQTPPPRLLPQGPLKFVLSPPNSRDNTPEGAQAGDFLNVLVSPEKPAHVHLISALLGTSTPPPHLKQAGSAGDTPAAAKVSLQPPPPQQRPSGSSAGAWPEEAAGAPGSQGGQLAAHAGVGGKARECSPVHGRGLGPPGSSHAAAGSSSPQRVGGGQSRRTDGRSTVDASRTGGQGRKGAAAWGALAKGVLAVGGAAVLLATGLARQSRQKGDRRTTNQRGGSSSGRQSGGSKAAVQQGAEAVPHVRRQGAAASWDSPMALSQGLWGRESRVEGGAQ